jgi:hypothetical protein
MLTSRSSNRYFPVVAVVMFWPYAVEPVMNFFEGV